MPTGSFKSRGMTTAVSMANHLGLKRLAVPTAGNAGGALGCLRGAGGHRSWCVGPQSRPANTPVGTKLSADRSRIIAARGRNVGIVAAARRLLTLVFDGLRDGEIRALAERAG